MFPDSPSSHPTVERLFFALLPPRPLALSVAASIEEMLDPGWTAQRADRLHVTLGITDDVLRIPADLLDRACRAGEQVTAAPFPIALDRLSIGHRSAALRPSQGNPALKALQRAIGEAMAALGVPMRQRWSFSPHMTLGYGTGRPVQRRVEERIWPVQDFVLIRSLVGRTQHRIEGRWPLHAVQPAQYELF